MSYIAPQYVNKKINRLLILSVHRKNKKTHCVCLCDCGVIKTFLFDDVKRENSKSCGCLHKEKIRTHNLSRLKLKAYGAWQHMKRRCLENFKQHHLYYDKGVTVCNEWQNDFLKFYSDMGNPPTSKHSLDRINGNKGYYKENCRWATNIEQMRNTNRNHLITYNGETKCLAEWKEIYNLPRNVIPKRLQLNWSIEKTLTTPVNPNYQRFKKVSCHIQYTL